MGHLKELEILFDATLSEEALALYYKTLLSWGVTDETIDAVVDEVIKKTHRFPALAAFWAAKIEANEWK